VTNGEWRAHLHPLAASHLAQLDHHVGVGPALPGAPQGEGGTRGRQVAVPLQQLDHDVGAGLVPALPGGQVGPFWAPTRGAPTSWFDGNVHRGGWRRAAFQALRAADKNEIGRTLRRVPRIDEDSTGTLEVARIPGNYGQIVGKRGRRNQ
jgi:hypothetical protein